MSESESRVRTAGSEQGTGEGPGQGPDRPGDQGGAPGATAGGRSAAENTGRAAAPGGWAGWVLFAGCMMVLLGVFQAIAGLVALFDRGYYVVTSEDLLVSVDYSGWGWLHLVVGVLLVAAGFGVFAGQRWARIVGIVFASLSAIVNLGFLAAFPLWSLLLITLDVIVIYALSVHGHEVPG